MRDPEICPRAHAHQKIRFSSVVGPSVPPQGGGSGGEGGNGSWREYRHHHLAGWIESVCPSIAGIARSRTKCDLGGGRPWTSIWRSTVRAARRADGSSWRGHGRARGRFEGGQVKAGTVFSFASGVLDLLESSDVGCSRPTTVSKKSGPRYPVLGLLDAVQHFGSGTSQRRRLARQEAMVARLPSLAYCHGRCYRRPSCKARSRHPRGSPSVPRSGAVCSVALCLAW